VRSWQRELIRAIQQAIDTGELRGDTDPSELVFALYGVILVLHHDARLLDSPDALPRARRAFDRLVASYAAPLAVRPVEAGIPNGATAAAARRTRRVARPPAA
jgi:hypothetical protein